MDNILRTLTESQIAVDLGCGSGSFGYRSYRCQILGIDVALDASALYRDGRRIQYVQSTAARIPLATGSVDAVICNHTFEHFPDPLQTCVEINRILNSRGILWIAIPDGYSFDDALYRRIFSGGGHVNRFTFSRLVEDIHIHTDLKLVQSVTLFSGFVYLKKPTPEQVRHFPKSARFLYDMPERLNWVGIMAINTLTRVIDKIFGSRFSQYGWGFVFARTKMQLDPLLSYFNVCWKCGCGNPAQHLKSAGRITRSLGLRFYSCSNCQTQNVFINPPQGLS